MAPPEGLVLGGSSTALYLRDTGQLRVFLRSVDVIDRFIC
jgi:hypothetical protein